MSKNIVSILPSDLVLLFSKRYKEDPIRFDGLAGVTPTWNPNKIVKLFSMYHDDNFTHEDIAECLGYERSTITKKINSIDWNEFAKSLYKLSNMELDEAIDEASKQYRVESLARIAIRDRRKDITIRSQLMQLEESLISRASVTPKINLPNIKTTNKNKKTRTPEHMVLLLSDIHAGLEFDGLDTGGLGVFNQEVLKSRMNNLKKAVMEINELHSELYPIPKLHVLALGDNIQGGNDIGNWGCAYNIDPVDKQIVDASDLISNLLSTWSNSFEKIEMHGVIGNHGRMEKKGMCKVRANFDNLVFALVKARMAEHKNVSVEYSLSWWITKNINNTKFCLVHGDNMKHSINSLIQEEQRIQSLLAGQEDPFDVMVAGHFHTHHEVETSRGRIILNGSLVGGDIYSMKNLKVRSRPTQTLMGVHPVHGITWMYNLDLDYNRDS